MAGTKWDAGSFCTAFLRNDYGRKMQHGSHYIKEFKNSRFLMWKPSGDDDTMLVSCIIKDEKVRGNEVAMWFKSAPYMFRNSKVSFNNRLPKYSINHSSWEDLGLDVTEAKIIDRMNIPLAEEENFSVFLLDVDKRKVLLHPHMHYYSCVEEFVSMTNIPQSFRKVCFESYTEEGCSRATQVPGYVKTVKEARENLLPEEVKADPNSFYYADHWFVPTDAKADPYDPAKGTAARFKPMATGWEGLPPKIVRSSWDDSPNLEQYLTRIKPEWSPQQIAELRAYCAAYQKYEMAKKYLESRDPSELVESAFNDYTVKRNAKISTAILDRNGRTCMEGKVLLSSKGGYRRFTMSALVKIKGDIL